MFIYDLPFPFSKPNYPYLDTVGRGQHAGLFTIGQRHILSQRRVQYVGQKPRELALASQMPKLSNSEIEIMVL